MCSLFFQFLIPYHFLIFFHFLYYLGYDHENESPLMVDMFETQMMVGDYIAWTQEATTFDFLNQTGKSEIFERINEEKKPPFFDFLGLGTV